MQPVERVVGQPPGGGVGRQRSGVQDLFGVGVADPDQYSISTHRPTCDGTAHVGLSNVLNNYPENAGQPNTACVPQFGHQIRCPGLPEKEVMASEVDALCLMCRVKSPPMCPGPSVSSVCGLEVGLAYGAGLLLAWVGDHSGGQLAALGGLWCALSGIGLVGFGVVAQAEAVADEEQYQAVLCCCLGPAGREV